MIKWLILVFILGFVVGFVFSVFLTMSKISFYEDTIQKLKKKAIRFNVERDDD